MERQVAIEILTQSDMQRARRALGKCFLCGYELPKRSAGFKAATTGEHVIPRAVLGDAPTGSDAWAVELDVHRDCERRLKQSTDGRLAVFHKVNTRPVSEWPREQLRGLQLEPNVVEVRGGTHPAFSNADQLIAGTKNWVRGLHATLYGDVLPATLEVSLALPVPAGNCTDMSSFEFLESFTAVAGVALDNAIQKGVCDRIVAWGGRLKYECTWTVLGSQGAYCFFQLEYPGVERWSMSVLGPGRERPWRGSYQNVIPRGAGTLVPSH